MEKISVIVPVYGAESYLDFCVKSIVEQTYRNLEIILVDDGSPDRCGAMCDAWAEKDERIRVIHQKNAGSGAARNAALDIATGTLIGMVDSDDYIAPAMYAYLHDLMTPDVGIAECEILTTEGDHAQLSDGSDAKLRICTAAEAMALHIQDSCFRQTPPNKLYRREVIADIRFPVGTRIDDEFFTYQVIGRAGKLIHSSCAMYAYRQQAGSQMHLTFAMPRLQAVEAKKQRLSYLTEQFPELVETARINLWYTCLYMGQMSLSHMSREEQKQAFELLLDALREQPLGEAELNSLPVKQRLWLKQAAKAFRRTCQIRNALKIGV